MVSPGQSRGLCGHLMAGFDVHDKCARCRDIGLGTDLSIVGAAICSICDGFSTAQREMLATPQYHIRKDYLVKGKVPKEIVDAVKDLKDLAAFTKEYLSPWVPPSSIWQLVCLSI